MAVIVITGASSGIGEATARELARRGHKLVLAARRVEKLEGLAAELARSTEVLTVETDVTKGDQVEALAQRAGERFGRIDVWINNAGIGIGRPWYQEEGTERIIQMVETNLTAAILGVRAALPWMKKQGKGHIINIGSVSGSIGTSGVYSATKFGIRGFSESCRREFGRMGIRCSLVSPGFIRTEMTTKVQMPMPPASVAGRAIANLVEHPRREIVVPGWYRLLIGLNRLFPGLVDWGFGKFAGRMGM